MIWFLKSRIALPVVLLLINSSFIEYSSAPQDRYIWMPVGFSSDNIPIIEVEIDGKQFPMILNLGSTLEMTLKKDALALLDKKFHEVDNSWRDEEGNLREPLSYLVSKVQLEELVLKDVIITEDELDHDFSGFIGSPLLEQTNLLLDFPNSAIYATDRAGLEQKGIFLKDMVKVPFKIENFGIILKINTDLGLKRFELVTGYSNSRIRRSIVPASPKDEDSDDYLFSSKYEIGGVDFGCQKMRLSNVSPDVDVDIDGILGMDFLSKHSVYIDYQNQFLYFSDPTQKYHADVPVSLSLAGTPIISVRIGGIQYPVLFDLGSSFSLIVDKKYLDGWAKKNNGVVKCGNFRGDWYEEKTYYMPEVNLNGLKLRNVNVNEENDEFLASTHIWNDLRNDIPSGIGSIGMGIMKKYNFLLDFEQDRILVSNDLDRLREEGYRIERMTKVPCQVTDNQIICLIGTDFGLKKFLLDTGFTISMLRLSSAPNVEYAGYFHDMPFYRSSQFVLGERDFGTKKLHLYETSNERTEFDGILGMDFLEDYPIYVDIANEVLYIGMPE